MIDVNKILDRKKRADSLRQANATIWRDIAPYVHPFKTAIGHDSTAVNGILDISAHAGLFDSSGIEANRIYAAGKMSGMTPSDSAWFSFGPPRWLAHDDAVKSWYSRCTDIAIQILADSNFYGEKHNLELDDGAFGTGGLFIEEDSYKGARFECLPIGDYSILENHYREVDTVFQDAMFSPRQAADKFGEDALPDKIKAILNNSKQQDKPTKYARAIFPRSERDASKIDQANMPWVAAWIEPDSKTVVQEQGFLEAPFVVGRHDLWTKSPYGISPGMMALYDMRQINVMQMQLDTLVEKIVTPPIIAPAEYEGVIDLRGGGVSFEKSQNDLRQWDDRGNYPAGVDRTSFRKRQIDKAFYVDLFQVLNATPVGKVMTAEEVRQRRNDSLPLFSPVFARSNKEMNGPIVRRLFAILLRAGAFPPVPEQLEQQTDEGIYVPDPEIVYTGRLALQMRQIHNGAAMEALQMAQAMAAFNPDVLDNIDIDKTWRGFARNVGMNEENIRPEQEIEAMRKQRAEAQARAEKEASQLEEADSASKLIPALSK